MIVMLASSSCGGGSAPRDGTPKQSAAAAADLPASARDVLVTAGDIRHSGAGTPGAALLRWWQAVQYGDTGAARALYASTVRPRRLAEEVRVGAGQFALARPLIQETQQSGRRAKLLTVIESYNFANGRTAATDVALTFDLVQDGGAWKLADDRFLAARLQAQRAAEQAAKRG